MRRLLIVCFSVTVTVALAAQTAEDLVKQGRALVAQGHHEDAERLFRQALRRSPRAFDALLALGFCLDLQGQYPEARRHLSEAVKQAEGVTARNQALIALGVSYAFEGKATEAAGYLSQVFDQQRADRDAAGAAVTANAAGRVYLESGDTVNARKWYDLGREQAKQIQGLSPSETDLWELRWIHAQARIAAREGKGDDARRYITAFEQTMNRRGKLADDNEIYRYLLGYVAYFTKDYDRAIAELVKGNLGDPFVMSLLARSYEAKADSQTAQKYYRRALESNTHNLSNAFARPIARAKVG